MPRFDLDVVWLGRVPYRDALSMQLDTHRAVAAGKAPDTVLLLEHEPVYTTGKRGERGGFLVPREELVRRGAEVVATDRGGLVTFHGPGQLVGYPILSLARLRLSLHCYVDILTGALSDTLSTYGIDARVDSVNPGVYVGGRKIASIGVRLSEGVTRHGFAVNLTTDLSWFEAVVACGLHGVKATSLLAETGASHPPEEFGRHATRVLWDRLVEKSVSGRSCRAKSRNPQAGTTSES